MSNFVRESKARSALNAFQKASRMYHVWPFNNATELEEWLLANVSPNFLIQFGGALEDSKLSSTKIDELMVGAADLMEGHWHRRSWQVLYDALIGQLRNWASFDFIGGSLSDSLRKATFAITDTATSIAKSASTAAKVYPWMLGIGSIVGTYLLISKVPRFVASKIPKRRR